VVGFGNRVLGIFGSEKEENDRQNKVSSINLME
jgi:hypothetical protein